MQTHQISQRLTILIGIIGVIVLALSGCVGPPVLERQVLGYDEVTAQLDQKLLLLNIARVDAGRPVHFTTTSSIAATFDWTTTVGVTGQLEESKGTDFFKLDLGASASENPTFSIIPITGEDFTKRVLTPFDDTSFQFLVFQGGAIDQIMRIMGAGFEIQNPDGSFARFIENDPVRQQEYEEFRRIALHLAWLNNNRKLFVRALVFEDTLIEDFKDVPRAEDINNGFNMNLRWRQKPDGNYWLSRFESGRVVVTNYDTMALSDQARFELNEKVKRNPQGFVYVHVRPDGPGGDFPIQGAIKLRSMLQILRFVGRSIRGAREFDVEPDLRTGPIARNPAATLQINVVNSKPAASIAFMRYSGKYYSVNDTAWDRLSFAQLGYLFQTTVGEVANVGIPITISK